MADVEELDLAGAGGAVVGAEGPCLAISELLTIERANWDHRQARHTQYRRVRTSFNFMCFRVFIWCYLPIVYIGLI